MGCAGNADRGGAPPPGNREGVSQFPDVKALPTSEVRWFVRKNSVFQDEEKVPSQQSTIPIDLRPQSATRLPCTMIFGEPLSQVLGPESGNNPPAIAQVTGIAMLDDPRLRILSPSCWGYPKLFDGFLSLPPQSTGSLDTPPTHAARLCYNQWCKSPRSNHREPIYYTDYTEPTIEQVET